MSFVAFPAHYAGTPPHPFRAFAAGEAAFYLVGVETANGHPAPSGQLTIFKDKDSGTGRDPIDTVTETAKGWQGRRRVSVATRTYSWSRYTKGALATARDSAQWTDPNGQPLRLWSFVVAVDDAERMGYRVPRGRMNARRGNRGVGHENNATGTVRGRSVVAVAPVSTPAPVVSRPAPVSRPVVAPVVAPVAEVVDPSVARFRLLDLSDDGPTAPVADDDDGPGRVPMID